MTHNMLAMDDVILRAHGLTKRYRRGRPAALDGIDLDIERGTLTALVGPNGAGKSTLIRTFLGFERPTGGYVTVAGVDPARDRARALAHIGYVGQDAGLYAALTAAQHLELVSTVRSPFDRAGAAERLASRHIPLDVPAGELSGGQQSQVALAMALATDAPILLLDEPVARLDPLARMDFLTGLREAADAGGTTVLLASHIIGDLGGICDTLVVLAPAAVMFHGSIGDARTGHDTVPATQDVAREDLVATFTDLAGQRMALVRRPGTGAASLEHVVLGYLAAASVARVPRGDGR